MSARRVAVVGAVMAAAVLGWCQSALAGTVGYRWVDARGQLDSRITFTAAPGEANDTVVVLTPTTAVISDTGHALRADPGYPQTAGACSFSGDTAVCHAETLAPFISATLILGDGNDRGRVEVTAPENPTGFSYPMESGRIYGGPGNDKLVGSAGDDRLEGGAGADDISGGGGLRDVAVYTGSTTGVNVTIDGQANDGYPGERDNVRNDVEEVAAPDADSVLVGNTSDNVLFGGAGNDVLRGGAGSDELNADAGNDTLEGNLGPDTFLGGAGDDTLWSRDNGPELRITCGDGVDTVYADALDSPDADCEKVLVG